jgi:hypothetical protein
LIAKLWQRNMNRNTSEAEKEGERKISVQKRGRVYKKLAQVSWKLIACSLDSNWRQGWEQKTSKKQMRDRC